jgi:transcriptional regulator with XRE-family HTH domain
MPGVPMSKKELTEEQKPLMSRFGPKLKRAIRLSHTSQQLLGKAVGLPKSTVSELCGSKLMVPLVKVLLIARELNLSLDYLFNEAMDVSDTPPRPGEPISAAANPAEERLLVEARDYGVRDAHALILAAQKRRDELAGKPRRTPLPGRDVTPRGAKKAK